MLSREETAEIEHELGLYDRKRAACIDALKIVADGVNKLTTPERGFLIITHYQRLLDYITPDKVHVFMDGRIISTGGVELAQRLEQEGYDAFRTPAAG